MKHPLSFRRAVLAALCGVLLASAGILPGTQAMAATDAAYPARPVRLIVPYAAGGGTDTVARLLAQKLTGALGQPVIVDNKPGAATQSGTSAVVKAAPDGYTLLMGTANLATNASLFSKLPYDAANDLAPISLVTKVPVYVFVNTDSPAKSFKELITESKAGKDGLSYGTAGAGSVPHLAGELLRAATGTRLLHVPYKGSSEAATALLGNQVDMSLDNLPPVTAHLKAGRVRALALAMPTRSTLTPDVPTLAELGYPIEAYSWWGVLAPAGTPQPIIDRLNREILAVLKPTEMRERFAQQGIEPVGSTPAEFAAHIRAETVKWAKAVKSAGVALQ